MKFIFYSPLHFEEWDWRNSIERGIGGSETSHVEMAWRLARRGHEVISYAPIPADCPGEWRDTIWKRYEEADFSEDGLWILYRCPEALDKFSARRPLQPRWLMCQDTWYPTMNVERAEKLDRVLALCQDHLRHLLAIHPFLDGKIWLTSNGAKIDLARLIESDKRRPITRDPKKLIYASSPDRGLVNLLQIFARAHEQVPDLSLHIFYGMNSIEKLLADGAAWAKQAFSGLKEKIDKFIDQPGVVWRGRVGQVDLYREWLSSGIWCYPTDFTETSCITCMEAQALGAVPITRPLWALADNVGHGIRIDGTPTHDSLTRARYAGEIIRLATQPELQERIRKPMMDWARNRHNWERWVDQWECDLLGLSACPTQFTFQQKHARGRILNIGCAGDPSNFAHRGAVNLDIAEQDAVTKLPNAAHVFADARRPLPSALGLFDTVILGDILEHMTARDQARTIRNAAAMLHAGGRLIITCPVDKRPEKEQHEQHDVTGREQYAHGVSAFHANRVKEGNIEVYCARVGLQRERVEVIDYNFCDGFGLIMRRPA